MSIIVTSRVMGGLIEGKMCGVWIMIIHLLPTGSEEREVLAVGSIPVAILPSCQYMTNIIITDMNIVG